MLQGSEFYLVKIWFVENKYSFGVILENSLNREFGNEMMSYFTRWKCKFNTEPTNYFSSEKKMLQLISICIKQSFMTSSQKPYCRNANWKKHRNSNQTTKIENNTIDVVNLKQNKTSNNNPNNYTERTSGHPTS